jgi:hypothetical protein
LGSRRDYAAEQSETPHSSCNDTVFGSDELVHRIYNTHQININEVRQININEVRHALFVEWQNIPNDTIYLPPQKSHEEERAER